MDDMHREYPWAKTSIGAPESWPDTWLAAARLCLDSSFPMILLLGQEYLFLYNDAVIPLTGGKHPQVLGMPASQAWPEIWDNPIEPMVSHVIKTGEPSGSDNLYLPLERNGYPEETHFIMVFSAIRGKDRNPNAVLITLRETTQGVLVARRVDCLDALAHRCLAADTALDVCTTAAQVMERESRDLPFTLTYLIEREAHRAKLAACSGLTSSATELAPDTIALDSSDGRDHWRLVAAVSSQETLTIDLTPQSVAPLLKEGSFVPTKALTIPLPDPAGGVAGVLVMGINPMRPVEEGARLGSAVAARMTTAIANANVKQRTRERVEALAALDRAKTLFLSDVSHEFRTPLTLLLSPLDEVLARDELTAPQRELLQTSRRAGTRLLKLVQSLLDFSRVEAGRVQASFEPTDLSALTSDIVSLFRSTFERAKVALVVDCAPIPEAVYVDRDMWEKIVLNLVSNAFKFTLAGEVRVSLRAQGEWVVLEVKDTGCGIAAADVPRVFDRFHRGATTRARSAEGSGIGLSLVQELLKLHGGRVQLRSEVDRGTCVTAHLPRGNQHLAPERIHQSRGVSPASVAAPFLEEMSGWVPEPEEQLAFGRGEPHQAAAKGGGKLAAGRARKARSSRGHVAETLVCLSTPGMERILIADDNADMRRYVRKILKEHWTVETAPDGMSALERIRQSPPDLLIADLMMPGLDGLSLLAALRDSPATADLPVLVLSARSNEEASVDALNAGADDYLPKPFSARELVARVEVQLARARLRHAERRARQAAEQSSHLKDELVTTLSQSLRNPLDVMLKTVALLKDPAGGEEMRRALDLIRASTREQHRLIDEVHDISCIAAGVFEVRLTRIPSLSTLVSEEVDALRPIATARRIRLESFIDLSAAAIEGDGARVRQIAHHLISHALSSTPATGNVIVECRGRAGFVEMIVRHNGAGISEEALPHVFDARWQLEHARSGKTGGALNLGLAVTHRIVELHGGRIFVTSDGEGRGAVFTVRLPMVSTPASTAPRKGLPAVV
jgi:signal transduction histidine kinase